MPPLVGVLGDTQGSKVKTSLQVAHSVLGVVRRQLKTKEKYAAWIATIRKSLPNWSLVTFTFTENGPLVGGNTIHPGRALFADVSGTYGGALSGTIGETDNCCFGMTNLHVKPSGKTIYKGNGMIGRFDDQSTGGSEINTDSYVFKILKGVKLLCQSGRAGKTDTVKCPPRITGFDVADDGDEVFKVGSRTKCTIGTVQRLSLQLFSDVGGWRRVTSALVSPEGASPRGDAHDEGAWLTHPFTLPGDSGSWVVRKRDGKVIGLNRGHVQQTFRTHGETYVVAFGVAVDIGQILDVHKAGAPDKARYVREYDTRATGIGNEVRDLLGMQLKKGKRMNKPGRIKNLNIATTDNPCTPCQ
jgi:hypothetical protein